VNSFDLIRLQTIIATLALNAVTLLSFGLCLAKVITLSGIHYNTKPILLTKFLFEIYQLIFEWLFNASENFGCCLKNNRLIYFNRG
jgi:hypothetical protein